jgi:hypothetical protein
MIAAAGGTVWYIRHGARPAGLWRVLVRTTGRYRQRHVPTGWLGLCYTAAAALDVQRRRHQQ